MITAREERIMKNLVWIVVFVVAVGCSDSALAAANGFYAGLGFGRTVFEDDDRFVGDFLDDDDKGFQVYGGYRFTDYFGVEGDYADLGDFDSLSSNMEVEAFAITAVGYLPIRRIPLELFGKAGFGVIEWDETAPSFDDSSGALVLGFGLALTPVEPMTLRLGLDIYSYTLEEYRIFGNTVSKREYDQAVGMSYLGIQCNF
jgi:opacity protein-like surface antigen